MRHLFFYFLFLSFSCNIKQDNSQQNTNNEGKPGQDTIRSVTTDRLRITPFNIASLIPEFSNDTNFHNISGIAVGTDLQKSVIYSIYRLPKKRAFEILNKKIKSTTLPDKKQVPVYSDLTKIDSSDFFKNVYGLYENNPPAKNFYDKLRSLKGYDIFFAGTPGYMHWLFFDKTSDTVYQRTQLLTF